MRYFFRLSLVIFVLSLFLLLLVESNSKEQLLVFVSLGISGVIALISSIYLLADRK